jgi:hypothetical protein
MHVSICCSSIMSSNASRGHRGSYKKSYSKNDVLLALSDYRSAIRAGRRLSYTQAALRYHVPVTTLRRYHRKTEHAIATAPRHSLTNEVVETTVSASSTGLHLLMLSSDMDQKLVSYIESCKQLSHPLTPEAVRKKAKRLYFSQHNIPITAENQHDIASKHWWQRFLLRHPTLSIRAPQLLALQRARATQPDIINHFYDLYKLCIDTFDIHEHQIWAMDETGVDNNFKVRKVVANKGM